MKKFGTPNGAGPGSANENVGLVGVGTPGPVIAAGPGLGFFLFVALLGLVAFLTFGLTVGVVLVLSLPLELFGLAKPGEVVLCVVVVLVGDELGDDDLVVDVLGAEVVVEGVVVVTVGVGAGVVGLWQFAVTLLVGGVPGGSIWAGGVPGAALTVYVTVWPSSRTAVTVH